MKFSEYLYERPNMDEAKSIFADQLAKFEAATSAEEQNTVIAEINKVRSKFESLGAIAQIRHTIDTRDGFYEKEQAFLDEQMPHYEKLISDFYKALIGSKFRSELEAQWGEQLFNLAEMQIKSFDEKIIGDLQNENKLATEYQKLMAAAKIPFQGEERTLAQMVPFMKDKDREVRKAASLAYFGYFEENEAKFDDLYDQLVKIRHEIALKLGYDNFVPLGYMRMMRSDYGAPEVANYRKQVLESLVPLSQELRQRQQKRLGLDELQYFDEQLVFTSGNPVPKGEPDWIVDQGRQMYKEMSPETHEFFSFMYDNELLDLVAKEGKAPGGYCSYISTEKAPFIFSNFNGTSGDVDVLTHEAGHAFQGYSSRELTVPEYAFPTYEACEIHSMSMEFFAWPWMENFFKEDTDKYKFEHLSEALLFIPYGVTVDEFQHFVYENPNATPDERKVKWREIEKKYLPHRDYTDVPFLEKGTFWYKQMHIFGMPFYYIDYTLAQVCALQFWVKSREDKETAWADYLRLCQAGGSQSFVNLVDYANLQNPFVDGTIKSVVEPVKQWLDKVDDTKL